jgi:hypothetical protein
MDAVHHTLPVRHSLGNGIYRIHNSLITDMNIATVIVLTVVAALVAVAVTTLQRGKGSCSCGSVSAKKCNNCNTVSCPFKR